MDRDKSLEMAIGQIEKQFGKGSVMRMGETAHMEVEAIPTGALALDLALGLGGLPRGRIVEIFGPESSGKCLVAGTYVWTDRGLETVAELFERCGQPASCTTRVTPVADLGVRAVNEGAGLEPVGALTHNDRRPVLRVELASGRHVTATANHPLRVLDERGAVVWREVGGIRPGDVVVSALFGATEAAAGDGLSEDEAVLLGYLAAAGGEVPGGQAGRDCTHLALGLFGPGVEPPGALRALVAERYGVEAGAGDPVTVPHAVRTAGHKAQRAFLSALFEAGGRIRPSREVSLAAPAEELARQVQLLLFGLGVACTLSGPPWTVTVEPARVPHFAAEVGFRSPERQRRLAALAWPAAPVGDRFHERVVAVEAAGRQPTFDLVMPQSHSFVANGVLSHNTTLAMHVVAEAQRNGGICAYVDAEHAVDPVYARAIGVNVDDLLISQPDTGEQALEISDMLIRSGALDVLVIDSVAALTPRAEIEGEMGDTHVGLQARLMSQALRKLTGTLSKANTIAIFINQLREKVGVMYGSPEVTPGGRALKFYSSVRLDIRRIESIKDGVEVVGNRVRVKVVKNKCAAPFKQAEFDIGFGKGISREGSLLDVGVDLGLVKKSGAWYTYEGEQLGQGRENAKTFLSDNPEIMVEVSERIRQAVGIRSAGTPDPAPAPAPVAVPGAGNGQGVAID